MKTLSVICARAGSKGLKNKCMARINDKTVVEYSIEYSLSLGNSVKTVVSTDIDALMGYCEKRGIEYIARAPELCGDNTRIDHTLADAIERKGDGCEYCSIVYGNVPIRYPEMFREAVSFLNAHKDYDAAISMHNVEKFHPASMFEYSENILPRKVQNKYRRQKLPKKMIHDGHTFLFRSEKFYKKLKGQIPCRKAVMYSVYGDKIKPMVNDKVVIEIDTKKDFELAKAFILRGQKA